VILAVFTNPAVLPALGLAAIPLILHLLTRRRVQRIPWAATRLLDQTRRKFRQRVVLRDLVLLLLRTAAVALAVLAAAGPRVSPSGWLGRLTSEDREVVLVLDTSASMGATAGGTSRLRRAVGQCRDLLNGLSPSDRVTLAAFDVDLRFITRECLDATDLQARLEALSPSPWRDDPLAALHTLIQDVRSRPGPRDVYVLSDFQATPWRRVSGTRLPEATDSEDPIQWFLVPVRSVDAGNLSLPGIRVTPPLPVRGETTRIHVRIENATDRASGPRRVTLRVNGENPLCRSFEAGPSETVEVTFFHAFLSTGPHRVEARLDPDALAADDTSHAVVDVAAVPLVTLVSEAPTREGPFRGDLDFMAAALEAGFTPRNSCLRLDRLSPRNLAEGGAGPATVLVVSGLSAPDPALARRLHDFLASGGSILFAASPAVQPSRYDEVLHGDGQEAFPLPFRLRAARDLPPDTAPYLTKAGRLHPALGFLAGLGSDHLRRAALHRILAPGALPPQAAVLLRCGHDSGAPLLVEVPHGWGRVFWFSTTLTPLWTDLPTPARGNHLFLPLMVELIRYAAHPGERSPSPGVSGHALTFTLPEGPLPGTLRIVGPDGLPAGPLRQVLGDHGRRLVTLPRAGRSGFYRLTCTPSPGGARSGILPRPEVRSVVHDAVESDPRSLEDRDLAALFPGSNLHLAGQRPLALAGPGRGGLLDSLLLAALGLCLVLECLLAWIFGWGRT